MPASFIHLNVSALPCLGSFEYFGPRAHRTQRQRPKKEAMRAKLSVFVCSMNRKLSLIIITCVDLHTMLKPQFIRIRDNAAAAARAPPHKIACDRRCSWCAAPQLHSLTCGGGGFAISRTNLHHSPNADKLVGQFVTLHELAGPLVLKRQ